MANPKVLTGTDMEYWVNGKLIQMAESIQIKIASEISSFYICGDRWKQHVPVGLDGSFSYTSYKSSSKLTEQELEDLQTGKITDHVIMAKIKNPVSGESERVAISNVLYNDYNIFDGTAGQAVKDTVNGKFSGIKYIDRIGE